MANIDPYIQQIQNAEYGEEVRSSIINALEKVNDDNESYQDLKTEIIAAKDDVEQAVSNYNAAVTDGEAKKKELETATSTANTAKTNLETATKTANTAKTNLTNATSTANTAKSNLETATSNANTAKTNAETAKTNLDASITAAGTSKTNLDSSKTAADTSKKNLDDARTNAETSRTNLNTTITNAGTAKTQLQGVIDDSETKKSALSEVVTTADEKKTILDTANQTADENKAALDSKNATASSNLTALDEANFNSREILTGVEDIKAYLGYTDEDIVGIQVDYENKSFQRLAGAYDLTGGSDFDKFEMFGGRKRCNVADDGTIVAWYGDDDYAEDGSMGQVMVYQPKFYYKVVPLKMDAQTDGVGYHLRKANYYVSTKEKTGFKLHPAFIDASGNEVDYILLSAFEAALWDADAGSDGTGAWITDNMNYSAQTVKTATDKLGSIAGCQPISYITRPDLETLAKNRGDGWHNDLIKAESANQMLMIIEMGMMNLQTAIANGVVSISDNSSYNCSSLTGSTSSIGNGTGQADSTTDYTGTAQTANGKTSITYRGVENPWGNIWKVVYGINIYGNGSQKGGIPYIANDFNFAESKNSGNYESAGFTVTNTNGYISAMGYGGEDFDWLFMASECLGNSSVSVGDYTYITANLNGYRIALLGGFWNSGSGAGGFCWSLNNGVGVRIRHIGGRLVYVPTKATATSYATNITAWKQKMVA
jgi:hypothetical protein